ncbi:uncharacterized protein LOC122314779 [Carya illinoinensis]|uniref:Uncharacterized protein n=1 Tax=Carya illinoinensis TaxID=32201 RepID=A0A8T1Q5X6_CARIL|nr:uncharacterized protein LOC122314779 [Carya illinoinensis]KAG6648852.1 hypothetical protein CIPAW_07G173200 [Carya illinoinensis]KAG6648853.1 hypothetical protein CIPAW_07G173200 [Carya illinoinensis]KAG6648854.1 hypothetical protein CIPAW_07G173200 [Carya illinoinensis]KAG6705360.1 hypothetical protein I3842_07G175600 [Carya illinoinensis]KAG6705361.1 hypothetical protein I3842_07G175600 [Carya illinoinensis]
MRSRKGKYQNKFVRFLTTPIRILGKARDIYVRRITDCATGVSYGQAMGCSAALPKSFSVSSSRSNDGEDLRELIRAASVRTLIERIDMDVILKQQGAANPTGSKGLPKCSSVGMGKIDEDRPCDFGVGAKADLLYPRSRSYAVTNTSSVY